MNIVIIISIIILCIYLVIVYKEYTKKDAKKNELTDLCSRDQCDKCPYKNFCYLYDEDIEKEED